MLDVALLGNPTAAQHLLILEPGRLVLYRRQANEWKAVDAAGIPPLKPWPRDIRGRIVVSGGNVEIRLPGLFCRGQAREKVVVECNSQPDPDGLTPGRNFYPAGRPGDENGLHYYGKIEGKSDDSHLQLASGTDGRTYVQRGGASDAVTSFVGWGSDLASLESECGLKHQVLATRAGDRTSSDAIRAYEIHSARPVAVSPPLEFAGPILSLQRTFDSETAVAIIRNIESGDYEAYRVTLACGN
jgi:hypothetical protein